MGVKLCLFPVREHAAEGKGGDGGLNRGIQPAFPFHIPEQDIYRMFSRNRKRLHILNLKGILRTHDPHADAVVFIDGVRDFFCNLFYFV